MTVHVSKSPYHTKASTRNTPKKKRQPNHARSAQLSLHAIFVFPFTFFLSFSPLLLTHIYHLSLPYPIPIHPVTSFRTRLTNESATLVVTRSRDMRSVDR
jgi:hypothetical protein